MTETEMLEKCWNAIPAQNPRNHAENRQMLECWKKSPPYRPPSENVPTFQHPPVRAKNPHHCADIGVGILFPTLSNISNIGGGIRA